MIECMLTVYGGQDVALSLDLPKFQSNAGLYNNQVAISISFKNLREREKESMDQINKIFVMNVPAR